MHRNAIADANRALEVRLALARTEAEGATRARIIAQRARAARLRLEAK